MLSYIAGRPEGVSLDELCEYFELPRTSAYDILITLVQTNMLSVKTGTRNLYQTGIHAYRIGMSYPNASDDLKLIDEVLKELAQQSGRTAFFGKRSGMEVLYILKEMPENPIITTATVGSTAPLYCTSLGKTILAFLPEEQANPCIEALDFQPRTEHTIRNTEDFRKDLAVTRSRGYALDFREYEDHMVCASAPVYDRSQMLLGAVSISGFYRPEDDYEQVGLLIKQKALEISHLLGYHFS